MAAAGFVEARGANEDTFAALDEALGVIGRIAAHHADGERLGDVLGDGQQLRHRLERPSEVVLIEPGDDHPLAAVRKGVARCRQVRIEELPFVDADDLGVRRDGGDDVVRGPDVGRGNPHVAVRHDVVVAEPIVDERLEDLHLLAGDLGAADATDQFLALAAEHAAGNDLDPAMLRFLAHIHRETRIDNRQY